MTSYQILAVAVALVAAVTDVRSHRIPNVLTFGAMLVAVLAHGYTDGWSGAGFGVAGWFVGALLFFPFFALGGMGAGDVKLLAAIGAWLGPAAIVWVALYASIAGAVMALAVGAWTGYLGKAFTNLWCLFMHWRMYGPQPMADLTVASTRGPRLAYAVPIFAGLMVTLWLR